MHAGIFPNGKVWLRDGRSGRRFDFPITVGSIYMLKLSHLVDDHHDGHEREALQVFMVLLAFLDGARALGMDVGSQERRLEGILKALEDRGVSL